MTYPNPARPSRDSPSTPTPLAAGYAVGFADAPLAAEGDYPRYPAGAGTAAAGGTPSDAQGRPGQAPGPGLDGRGRVRRTRISGVWIGLVAAGVFLILLIIFMLRTSTTPDPLPWAHRPGVDRPRLATGRRLRADHRRGAGERADLATA